MPKTSSKFYAVARGRCPGIYNSWEECKKHTDGFKGAVFKSFTTLQEAEEYFSLHNNTNKSESHLNSSKKRKFVDETPITESSHDANPSISTSGGRLNPIVIEEGLKLQQHRATDSLYPNLLNPTKDMTAHSVKSIQPPVSSKLYAESDSRCPETCTSKQDERLNPTDGYNSLKVKLYFDGGSRGNGGLGLAGAGIYLQLVKIQSMDSSLNHPSKEIITHKIRKYCGTHVTNNVAEYTGLLQGLQSLQPLVQDFLEQCKQNQFILNKKTPSVDIQVFGDSKLVIDQIIGIMKVKNENLQRLHSSCMEIIRAIQKSPHLKIQFQHIYRDSNKIADALANEAMNQCRSWTTIEKTVE